MCLGEILKIWKKSIILKDNQDLCPESLVLKHSVFDGLQRHSKTMAHLTPVQDFRGQTGSLACSRREKFEPS